LINHPHIHQCPRVIEKSADTFPDTLPYPEAGIVFSKSGQLFTDVHNFFSRTRNIYKCRSIVGDQSGVSNRLRPALINGGVYNIIISIDQQETTTNPTAYRRKQNISIDGELAF
jgi:hypothetical protein